MLRSADFSFLKPYLLEEKKAYLWGCLWVLTTTFCLVAVPSLIGHAIKDLKGGAQEVGFWALMIIVAVIFRGITIFWTRRLIITASRRVEYRLRNHMFRHMESQDQQFFTNMHTGDLLNRFTTDVDAVRAVLGPGIMYSLNTACILSLSLALMISINARLALYSMIPLVFLTFVIRFMGPKIHRAATSAQERLSELSTLAQENFSHVKLLKSFVREDSEFERMEEHSNAYLKQNMRMVRLRAWTNALLFLMGDLVILFLLAIGGREMIAGELSLGDFATFKGAQLLLIWPMIALGWVMNIFQRGSASAKRLSVLLEAQPSINDDNVKSEAKLQQGKIEFKNVGFAYDEDKEVLQNISFRLEQGQSLGIVGRTGSGKTSLLQLIARLRDCNKGEIHVDNWPIQQIKLGDLREALSYVPQEAFLFSATIRENIEFGVDSCSDKSLHEIASLVGIHEEILSFPNAYDQRVGERGITLSGGQKQRIALARALLKRPKILLLDDVLSAVDAQTEHHILSGLKNWTQDLSTVIVTHRLSSVRHADLILVLDKGKIIQQGTHKELLATDGYYQDLHQKQSIASELEDL